MAMLSVGEYFKRIYRPDGDYVDGRIEKRASNDSEHCLCMAGMAAVDWAGLGLRGYMNVRMRTAESRYRVVDFCATRRVGSIPRTIEEAPVICAEVLSRADRLAAVMRRAGEYEAMGVPHIWILDPVERAGFEYRDGALRVITDGLLKAPEVGVNIQLAEIFDHVC